MEEIIALIDKIIAEHRTIFQRLQTLEQAANDAEAIVGLDKAKEAFVPGRFEQKQGLEKLQKLLETIDQGLRAHFDREEGALLSAVKKHADKRLASALHSLLLEHEDLRDRLTRSREYADELTSGGLSRHLWEASAHDMRAYINYTRKLFKAHAEMEQELLRTLRSEFSRGMPKGADNK